MSPMLLHRTQIAAKQETTEGQAMTLANTDAFLAFRQGDPQPNVKMYERSPYRESLSMLPSLPGERTAKLPFQVELTGSGTAGTAPFWGKLMKPCAFAETVTPATSVAYSPASLSIPSMTLAAYMDGVIYLIWGARGNLKLVLEIGKPGLLQFDFEACDFSQLDGALLTGVTYSAVIPPAFLGATFTLDGVAFLVNKVDIDFGNTLAPRPDPNAPSGTRSVLITGRKPKITLDPEMMLASTKDIWTMWKNGATGALACTMGSVAGNTIALGAGQFQLEGIKHGERSGLRTVNLTALLAMSSGDDEFSLTLT